MDEKRTYQVYVGIMKLHKKYVGKEQNGHSLGELISDINTLNSSFNSNFCNAMTDILRRCVIKSPMTLETDALPAFYTDLWRFHKKYMNMRQDGDFWERVMADAKQLNGKYNFRQFQDFVLAIMDDLEMQNIGSEKQEQMRDGEKEKERPKSE